VDTHTSEEWNILMDIVSSEPNKFTREKALKTLVQLAKPERELIEYPNGRVYCNDELIAEQPNEEQEEWLNRRMRGSVDSWQRWFVGKYFTEEQKKELGLTDEDIAGRGMG
jgi:hypothetical protein